MTVEYHPRSDHVTFPLISDDGEYSTPSDHVEPPNTSPAKNISNGKLEPVHKRDAPLPRYSGTVHLADQHVLCSVSL